MTKIKICGIYRNKDAEYINETRPDYFGMIIDFKKSHRCVSVSRAAEIRKLIKGDIPAVGVFVNDDISKIEEMFKAGVIDIAQLHGDEDDIYIEELQKKSQKPVWKAFKIRDVGDVEAAKSSKADMILLDNGYGTGEKFNWELIEEIERPFALAGGLTPQNITEAVRCAAPDILDISSGVETDRKKDREKMREAIELAHFLKGEL